MGLLSGPITFECFRIVDSDLRQFGPEQIEILEQFAIGRLKPSTEQADVGFWAASICSTASSLWRRT